MARPLRIIYPGASFHVTSRGNEQKDVFKSQRDREKFLEYPTTRIKMESPDGNLDEKLKIWDAILDSMKPMFVRKK